MTACLAGAPSARKQNWNQVNWSLVQCLVNRLQMRIAEAVRQGRWHKVKALQYLLSRSFYAKMLAVKRIISNKGKRTPGIDGVIWKTHQQFWCAVLQLKTRGYKAQPLRRCWIPKSNGQQRPLGIPTMHDRAMQALYALALKPVAETLGDKHSYGFREKRSLHDAIKQCFISLATRVAAPWVLDADIKACFDRISHDWLLEHIPLPKKVLEQWLKSGYMEQSKYSDSEEGTPQGSIISPILCNMTLDGLESIVIKGRNKKRQKLNVIRYADDFVITGATEEILRDEILPAVTDFLRPRGLTLSEEKTHLRPIDEGFDFLGFTLRKFNGKLITTPSHKKVTHFRKMLKTFLNESQNLPFDAMLRKLNSKLRGWAFSNRQVVAKRLFRTLDNALYYDVCRWLRHRHRNKTNAWIKHRYWSRIEGRNNLGTFVLNKQGERQWLGLFRMADVPIRRHLKIRGEANPYDPAYRDYFKDRAERQCRRRNYDRLFLASTPLERALIRG
jgi:RNA-directed DNA polymerase